MTPGTGSVPGLDDNRATLHEDSSWRHQARFWLGGWEERSYARLSLGSDSWFGVWSIEPDTGASVLVWVIVPRLGNRAEPMIPCSAGGPLRFSFRIGRTPTLRAAWRWRLGVGLASVRGIEGRRTWAVDSDSWKVERWHVVIGSFWSWGSLGG